MKNDVPPRVPVDTVALRDEVAVIPLDVYPLEADDAILSSRLMSSPVIAHTTT